MRALLIALLVTNACAAIQVNNKSRVSDKLESSMFALASKSFERHVPCSKPSGVALTIQDVPILELNKGRNAFKSDGIYLIQGEYNANTKTISLPKERPDVDFVLFHELSHFLITESPDCAKFRDVKEQHKFIDVMEYDYFAATGRTREQEEAFDWALEAVKQLVRERL